MKVRSKLAFASGLGLLFLLAIFYLGGRLVVIYTLKQAERGLINALPEIRRSLQHEHRQLKILAKEKARSDYTLEIVSKYTQGSECLQKHPADRLGTDLIAISVSNQIAFLATSTNLPHIADKSLVCQDTLELLQENSPLIRQQQSPLNIAYGLVMVAEVPFLAAIAPIPATRSNSHDAEEDAVACGYVLVARMIGAHDLLQRLALGFPARIALSPDQLSAELTGIDASDQDSQPFQLDLPDIWSVNKPMRVRLPLHDVYGRPTVSLLISLPHSFKGLADLALSWLVLAVAAVGAIFIIPLFIVQSHTVLDPLSKLVKDVQAIGTGVPGGRRLKWSRVDEFGVVANTIDQMLVSIDREHKALQASSNHLKILLNLVPDFIFVVDGDSVVIDLATERPRSLGGLFKDLGVGGRLSDIPELPASAFNLMAKLIKDVLATRQSGFFEYDLKLGNGNICWIEGRMVFLAENQVLVMLRDISERRKALRERERIEQKMAMVQKTESLGVLAGGMAHDFNNILTAMLGNIEMIMSENLSKTSQEAVENVRLAMIKASNLTRQMLSYAGRGTFTFESIDINELMVDLMRLMKRSVAPQIELVMKPGENLPLIRADPTQIWQVIMNLVINSSDAMAALAGDITLSTACKTLDAAELEPYQATQNLDPGRYVIIKVSDTGHGMDKRTIERIFDPFFTTKSMGRGLGLSACIGIIRAHKGAISVVSQPSQGTTVSIILPASDAIETLIKSDERDTVKYQTPPDARSRVGHGGEGATPDGQIHVLVVDDDPAIARLASMIIQKHDMKATASTTGEEALQLFTTSEVKPILAIIDVNMDGAMSGSDICAALKKISPELLVVVMSGYNESEIKDQFKEAPYDAFLAKPFLGADLTSIIDSTLQKQTATKATVKGS